MANRRRETPAQLTESWPDVPSRDAAGETARQFALNLRAAIGDRSVRSVAREVGIDEGTIRNVLSGAAWPDLHSIARLEHSLRSRLYPWRPNTSRAADVGGDEYFQSN